LITCYPFYYVGAAPKRYVVHAKALNTSEHKSSAQNAADAAPAPRLADLDLAAIFPRDDSPRGRTADPPVDSGAVDPESGPAASLHRTKRAFTRPAAHTRGRKAAQKMSAAETALDGAPESRFPSLDLAAESSPTSEAKDDGSSTSPAESGIPDAAFASSPSENNERVHAASGGTRNAHARSWVHPQSHRKTTSARSSAHAAPPQRASGLRGFFHRLFKGGDNR